LGSQLVVSSDRLPADLAGIEERLRERFAGGLVTDITRPDRGTRLAILRKRATYDGVRITDEALGVIADGVTTNVRALEGALIRVVALGSLERRPLDASLAADVLGASGLCDQSARRSRRTAHPSRCVCTLGVERSALLSRSRAADVAWARQAAMYLARELTDHSLPTDRPGVRQSRPHDGAARLPSRSRRDQPRTRGRLPTSKR